MLFKADFNENLTAYSIAQALVKQSFSVIPVFSNKHAAHTWKPFQTTLPTNRHLQHWFSNENHQHLAIICGKISRLIVLDFDSPAQFARFKREHPELLNTLIIKTKRGWHLYFRIPANTHVQSRQRHKIDLLAEGKYAICPPSTIKGHTYIIDQAAPILEITAEQIQQIETFVIGKLVQHDTANPDSQPQTFSKEELQGIYQAQARVGNRNNTLFRVALTARDTGWSEAETIAALAYLYANQLDRGERVDSRYREAVRTIKSAFSRPARPIYTKSILMLPNSLREKFNQMGLTCVIRVIETLWQMGYQSGDNIHPETLWHELEGKIGRNSIYKALKVTLEDGSTLFDRYKISSPCTPNTEASATLLSPDSDNKCLLSGRKKSQKVKAGRPLVQYIMPALTDLFRKLGVNPSRGSDDIAPEAYCSAKATRKALLEAFLRRKPGRHGRDMLARRAGVCVRTIDTYHKEFKAEHDDFNKRHRFDETPLHWGNLNLIPNPDLHIGGLFLSDDTGRSYPAHATIATQLLQQGRKVSLFRQTWNEYWFGHPFSPAFALREQGKKPLSIPSTINPEPIALPKVATVAQNRANSVISSDLADSKPQYKQEVKKNLKNVKEVKKDKKPQNPRRKMQYPEDEKLVEHLQERVNAICTDKKHHISKRTLRWLIYTYGKSTVKRAIRDVEKKDYINQNPTGFLIVMLRSDSKRKQAEAFFSSLKRVNR